MVGAILCAILLPRMAQRTVDAILCAIPDRPVPSPHRPALIQAEETTPFDPSLQAPSAPAPHPTLNSTMASCPTELRSRKSLREQLLQRLRVDGLDEVAVEAGGLRLTAVLLLAVAGDGDEAQCP